MNPPLRFNIPGVVYPEAKPLGRSPAGKPQCRFTPQQKAEIETALLHNWKMKQQADEMGLNYSSVMCHVRRHGWKLVYISKEEHAHLTARRERKAARAAARAARQPLRAAA